MKDLKFKMKTWISNSKDISFISFFCFNFKSLETSNYCMIQNAHFTLTWDPSELEKVHTYLIELTRKPRWNVAIHHFTIKKRFSSIRKFECNSNKNAKMGYHLPISVLLNIHRTHMRIFLNSKRTQNTRSCILFAAISFWKSWASFAIHLLSPP